MRRESKAERAAWTAHIEGTDAPKFNKYGAERKNGYASKHEADVAANLQMLAARRLILGLEEQVRIVLIPGAGKLRPIIYVADFRYKDLEGFTHIVDAKGYKTAIYRLKKRMAALLLGISIEEV